VGCPANWFSYRVPKERKGNKNTFAEGLMLNISSSSSSSSLSSSNKLMVERFGAGLETSAVWNKQNNYDETRITYI
jgi:hypothetical protein